MIQNKKRESKIQVYNESCSIFNRKKYPTRNILVVVDMQNDFISGTLSNYHTNQVEQDVVKEIMSEKYNVILFTKDKHNDDSYFDTLEGKKIPVKHCIENTDGQNLTWDIMLKIDSLIEDGDKEIVIFEKDRFCSLALGEFLNQELCVDENDIITIIGVCTDICVVSNALYLRAMFPNTQIKVLSSCCAGTSIKAHFDSLTVMENCNIDIEY